MRKCIIAYKKDLKEMYLARDRYWNWVAERAQANP
jgi:hypothetical protein